MFDSPVTPGLYTLSLHDALPISHAGQSGGIANGGGSPSRDSWTTRTTSGITSPARWITTWSPIRTSLDRKSTRLNSSHLVISYAVFCLKKKKVSSIFRKKKRG